MTECLSYELAVAVALLAINCTVPFCGQARTRPRALQAVVLWAPAWCVLTWAAAWPAGFPQAGLAAIALAELGYAVLMFWPRRGRRTPPRSTS